MKKLTITKKEAIRFHRKMWHWLAKNPKKNKKDWPGMKEARKLLKLKENQPYGSCFLCQYDENFPSEFSCSRCPLDWGKNLGCEPDSYYDKFLRASGEKRTKFAYKIATLKERKFL